MQMNTVNLLLIGLVLLIGKDVVALDDYYNRSTHRKAISVANNKITGKSSYLPQANPRATVTYRHGAAPKVPHPSSVAQAVASKRDVSGIRACKKFHPGHFPGLSVSAQDGKKVYVVDFAENDITAVFITAGQVPESKRLPYIENESKFGPITFKKGADDSLTLQNKNGDHKIISGIKGAGKKIELKECPSKLEHVEKEGGFKYFVDFHQYITVRGLLKLDIAKTVGFYDTNTCRFLTNDTVNIIGNDMELKSMNFDIGEIDGGKESILYLKSPPQVLIRCRYNGHALIRMGISDAGQLTNKFLQYSELEPETFDLSMMFPLHEEFMASATHIGKEKAILNLKTCALEKTDCKKSSLLLKSEQACDGLVMVAAATESQVVFKKMTASKKNIGIRRKFATCGDLNPKSMIHIFKKNFTVQAVENKVVLINKATDNKDVEFAFNLGLSSTKIDTSLYTNLLIFTPTTKARLALENYLLFCDNEKRCRENGISVEKIGTHEKGFEIFSWLRVNYSPVIFKHDGKLFSAIGDVEKIKFFGNKYAFVLVAKDKDPNTVPNPLAGSSGTSANQQSAAYSTSVGQNGGAPGMLAIQPIPVESFDWQNMYDANSQQVQPIGMNSAVTASAPFMVSQNSEPIPINLSASPVFENPLQPIAAFDDSSIYDNAATSYTSPLEPTLIAPINTAPQAIYHTQPYGIINSQVNEPEPIPLAMGTGFANTLF